MSVFCPRCGTPRIGSFRFCTSCQYDFEAPGDAPQATPRLPASTVPPASSEQQAGPAASPSIQAGVAGGMYELEQLRIKLIVGRLAGIAVGVAIWWFVIGPAFGGDFIPTAISLVVVLFGGLWVGQMVTLSLVSGRR